MASRVEYEAEKMARTDTGLRPEHSVPSKQANIVADALSKKSYCSNMMVRNEQPELCDELEKMKLQILEQG